MTSIRHDSSRGRLLDRLPIFCGGDRRRVPPYSKNFAASCLLVLAVLASNAYYMITTATSTRVSVSNSPDVIAPLTSSSAAANRATPNVVAAGPNSLLSVSVIRDELLAETPWAESHGSDHNLYLGAGMLYYGFAYAFQARTVVVLGSGGGFVPRILKQAQRDLAVAGRFSDGDGGGGDLYLVDAHLASAGWGSTFYAENLETVMRQKYRDINYLFNTTDVAFEMLKERGVTSIDYLHIDADHSFEQSYKDFTNYVQLLSPRGVVSFHDTCFDEKRKCRSGVPKTVAAIASQLEAWGLQLIDAHYLYRGIAFAIRSSAPAVDPPQERRRNFCKNNAERLTKASVGFTLNKRVGKLDTLGDFYDCNKKFNMSELVGACPYGKFRDGSGRCSLCIPGLGGRDCTEFVYDDMRRQEREQSSSASAPVQQSHLLAATWLSDQRSMNILEMVNSPGASVTGRLHHPIASSTLVGLHVERPSWSETDGHPLVRQLPCHPLDLLPGGRYQAEFSKHLNLVDAVLCWDCDRQELPRLDSLVSSLPRAQTIVFEGSRTSETIEEVVRAVGPRKMLDSWNVEYDLLLTDNRGGQRSRRIVMIVRSR